MKKLGLVFFSAIVSLGCGSSGGEQSFQVTVLDGPSKAPIANALVAVEKDGIYVANADPSKANPSYQFGGRADANGVITMTTLPDADLGFHVFAPGHKYGPLEAKRSKGSVTISVVPQTAADLPPTLSAVQFDAGGTVAPGGSIVLHATAKAANKDNPLSEEILVILPSAGWAAEMDPPSPGMPGVMYPDGEYKKTIKAPSSAGDYVYSVVVSSEGCSTSEEQKATLHVK